MEAIPEPTDIGYKLKYNSLKAPVLERIGDYEGALKACYAFMQSLDEKNEEVSSKGLLFLEERHSMEINSLKALERRNRLIIIVSASTVLLLILCLRIYYRLRLSKAHRMIAEKEREEALLRAAAER